MTTDTQNKAVRITSADIESVAKAGVQRALAARASATELSAEEIEAVSGGLSIAAIALPKTTVVIRPGTLAGPMPIDIGKLGSIVTKY